MRSQARTVAAVAVAIAMVSGLGGCVAGGPSSADPVLRGTWHLTSGSDDGKGIPLGGRSVTLTIGDADHTGGTEPCSSYTASVIGSTGPIFIHATITSHTRDDCTNAGLGRLENLYITALTSTTFAAITDGALVLTSPRSSLMFVRVAPMPVPNLLLTRWQLYSIPGQVPAVTSGPHIHPIYLRFDGSQGLTISSTCTAVSASYELTGENFDVFNYVSQTLHRADCTDADRALTAQAMASINGPLLLDVSHSKNSAPATLVITNLDDDLPVVWRATH